MSHPVQPYMPGFESEQRRRDLSQFYTPRPLAERLCAWMLPDTASTPASGLRILEPAAGRGALIAPLIAARFAFGGIRELVAYETDPFNVEVLEGTARVQARAATEARANLSLSVPFQIHVRARDFLHDAELQGERFHLAPMNPPFENDQDIDFIERVCGVTTRAVSVCQARIVHSEGRSEFWRWHDIRREAVLSKRPRFGGDYSPETDFVVLEIVRRAQARKQGEASAVQMEWWT